MLGLGEITGFLGKAIDKIFPDKDKANEAKLKMLELEQQGEFKEIDLAFKAIVSESQSADKWTSRARPSFMYVMYILFLMGIVMGGLYAFSPEIAENVTTGFKAWFEAIPENLYWLFGTGYLGYSGARSYEKVKKVAK